VRILRGFLKGVHLSRIAGSQIHPGRNATKSRACCGNDAPRAEKRDTDWKVLALPSEHGKPHRTRVPTFPQQRLRRRTNLPKLQNPPKSQGLTDSCAEPKLDASQLQEEPVGIRWAFPDAHCGFDQHLQVVFGFEPFPTSVERYSQTSQVKNSPLKFGFSKRSTVGRAISYVPRPPPPATSLCRRGSNCWVRGPKWDEKPRHRQKSCLPM
jgi:hypothetical protein